jgi:hypothetical protein
VREPPKVLPPLLVRELPKPVLPERVDELLARDEPKPARRVPPKPLDPTLWLRGLVPTTCPWLCVPGLVRCA